jgi:hypothetical protein
LRYNLFYYVYILSFYDLAKQDARFLAAYQQLEEKTINDKIIPEKPHIAWNNFDFARKGQISEMASKR